MTKPRPLHCKHCDLSDPPEDHWHWGKDRRLKGGGSWKCAARYRESYKRYAAENARQARVRRYRHVDAGRGVPSITWEEAEPLLALPCHYCERPEAGGLDRLNHNLGHEVANVRPCCAECNYILSDLPVAVKDLIAPALKQARDGGLLSAWKAPHLRSTSDPAGAPSTSARTPE